MEALSSEERYLFEDGSSRRVLEEISLSIGEGEAWGVTSPHPCDTRLLLEIMGNIRPYDGGRCVLTERGMLRRKRVILPHVFYIGGSGMAYDNMNTLEYLTFAASKKERNPLSRQRRLFDFLLEAGLGYLSLTVVGRLTREEKALVTLIAAMESDSLLLLLNLPQLRFDEPQTVALSLIASRLREQGRTLVVGAGDPELIDRTCTHGALLSGGRLLFSGPLDELHSHDPVELILRDEDPQRLLDRLSPLLPGRSLRIRDGLLLVHRGDSPGDERPIYEALLREGLLPEAITRNRKNAKNAMEELQKAHDLQEQLSAKGASPGLLRRPDGT